jgi:hypothetical protein
MLKFKDSFILSLFSGLCGLVGVTLLDSISLKLNISKRSYRQTAAGIFVPSKREATSLKGQSLGFIMNAVASIFGAGLITTSILKTGRDYFLTKGFVSGIMYGAILMALQSGFAFNKQKPKDAGSNLSYVVTNGIYGLITASAITKFGDNSLFDRQSKNDYLIPDKLTSEQKN